MDRGKVEVGLACAGLGLERLLNAWLRGPASGSIPLAVGVICTSAGAVLVLLAARTLFRSPWRKPPL
jgi:hypothetical protein